VTIPAIRLAADDAMELTELLGLAHRLDRQRPRPPARIAAPLHRQ
jgi:hypothetical protein